MLPNGAYTPQLFLVKFGSVAHHVEVDLAATANGASTRAKIKEIVLPPHMAESVPLPAQGDVQGLTNSLSATVDGRPGEVALKMVSATDTHEAVMLGKDDKDQRNSGNHPWSTDDGNTSTLLLFNRNDAP